jgi:ABC-type transporter Mla MlaB component
MFSLISVPNANDSVTLALTGNVSEDVLPEIDRWIDSGRRTNAKVALDLSEVTLIDRVSARFFAEQVQRGIEIVDCPSYLRPWILREVSHESKNK